jgi:glutamate--cysteine ligase
VAKKFAKLLGMDPWLINPMFAQCGAGQLLRAAGLECVQGNVDALLGKIRRKYKEYGINEKPFVVVKADNGTYGMGIMTVRDAKELTDLNRRTRNKMSVVKDGQAGHRGHHPGRRAHLRAGQRRRGRAGGLHDRPLRGRRLLPRARRARCRREPQRARRRLRAAGLRAATHLPRPGEKPGPARPTASTCTA